MTPGVGGARAHSGGPCSSGGWGSARRHPRQPHFGCLQNGAWGCSTRGRAVPETARSCSVARSVAALASKALGLVPHCPAGVQERGEQQSAGRSRPAGASPKGPPPRVPRAGPRPGETRGPEPAAGRAAPSASRPALPPGPPKERAPPPRRAPTRRARKEARTPARSAAGRPGRRGVCGGAGRGDGPLSASPGALLFTANWTFRSERNNHSPRRRGPAVNADVTHNVTLPVRGVPAPGLGSRPTPRFFLIMEVISL